MDDFTPYGCDFDEALSNLYKVLKKCIEMDLSLRPKKCEFLTNEGTILGHSISKEGIYVDPNKISIIKRVPTPQNQWDDKSFLRITRYYKGFIKDFCKVPSRFFRLLAKDLDLCWTNNCQVALEVLKEKLTTAPILRGPN